MENKPQSQEGIIDFNKLANIAIDNKKQVGGIIIGCILLATGISFVLPKQYESTTLVQTCSAGKELSGGAALLSIAGVGTQSPTMIYIELMKSRTVLEPIIDSLEWPDEKKKPDAKTFAKKNLDIKNTKGTNLIEVTAKGKTPEEAQTISQSVVDNFLVMQTDKAKQTQSLLVQFLNERIEDAKAEAEDASQKFADFQKIHKMYSPDEQAKITVKKLEAFDDALKDIKVSEATTNAKLGAVNAKLSEIKAGSRAYNINDNTTVQNIRSQLVSQQVELVGLRQQYTENHPSIISAKEKLMTLQNKLVQEVDAVVDSNATSVNPTQATLLKEQAESEAGIAVAVASEKAIKECRAQVEDNLTNFPQESIEYMQLQRDATIKNEIYVNLVKQCEKDKIQEAMESMDIQIVDGANLPDEDKPSSPIKKVIILIGAILGCLGSFCWILLISKMKK
jgi:uncharacterized protein involved in exopolysaccharide biosynthesis